jgi:hypothetical protein
MKNSKKKTPRGDMFPVGYFPEKWDTVYDLSTIFRRLYRIMKKNEKRERRDAP